jgi:hypothetical protein
VEAIVGLVVLPYLAAIMLGPSLARALVGSHEALSKAETTTLVFHAAAMAIGAVAAVTGPTARAPRTGRRGTRNRARAQTLTVRRPR